MSVYVRLPDSAERLLLDTKKAKLVSEGVEYDLTGATLDLYEVDWLVGDGTLGEETPCRVLVLTDVFTGLRIETPFPTAEAEKCGRRLLGKRRRRLALA